MFYLFGGSLKASIRDKIYRFVPAALLAFASLSNASGSLVYDSTVFVTGAGFGNITRDLTVHGRATIQQLQVVWVFRGFIDFRYLYIRRVCFRF